MIPSTEDQEKVGPRPMTRETLFLSNKTYTGQEELKYLQGDKAQDTIHG